MTESFADLWDDQFLEWPQWKRDAWYAKWEAMGIPPAEVEPIRPEFQPRMSGSEVMGELDHFRSLGMSARDALEAVGRGWQATEILCRRQGRSDLASWITATFQADRWATGRSSRERRSA